MAKMDEQEFQAIVRNEVESSLGYQDSEYSEHRIQAMGYYYGEPFGNEVEGRSQVVATEVADTIEFIMPTLMRMFTSSSEYVRFVPRQKDDIELADQASDYVNYIINHDNPGFQVFHDWFKDGLFSLFRCRWDGISPSEAAVSNGYFCEGIMFTHPDDDRMAKLRRDMFDWYNGRRH